MRGLPSVSYTHLDVYKRQDSRRYVVNSTLDEGDADVGDLDCYTASGKCTLRAAIQEANSTNNADKITFNIPNGDVHTINPVSYTHLLKIQLTISTQSKTHLGQK